MRCATPFG
ncbi:hypothetical protein LINGRAHAP2_LOCUS16564 [Linum grandiflorum]